MILREVARTPDDWFEFHIELKSCGLIRQIFLTLMEGEYDQDDE